ncbi:hydroxymethylglutaryl-CoA lyase [Desulfosarcina ovata]|uniref:Hydroxymethylglutaryl-CoA lyase n=1 Tax=Desulfosarcina ovata subsp. ovata TaxID=2752305 RepID=A0A5K8ADB3_9BACT|nr:hydroxymethylglutaryl-CoA lyase [Desulfosarcina ovata]BBO90516.1 hydroxymethylglutaryl-CoA lyase [Desulfosarcina ovata subsp. ovata]
MHPKATPPELLLEDEALRDGLQVEARIFSLEEKLHLFRLMRNAGVKRIQVGAFVHSRIIPQMADTDELVRTIGKQDATVVSALILNDKGLERALDCGVSHLSMSVSMSDTHSRKNARKPAAEALASMTRLIGDALKSGLDVRAGLQCVFGCIYEGRISEDAVLRATEKMVATGVKEINLADTTGMASPLAIRKMVTHVQDAFPGIRISLHLHDTRGLGLANMFAGYEAGVRSFDTCTAGLGGCPFVKGAAGNVPTEDAVNLFESMGIATGIDLAALCEAVDYLETTLVRPLPGRMRRVFVHSQEQGDVRETSKQNPG